MRDEILIAHTETMNRRCPNSFCQSSTSKQKIRCDGHYFRKNDSRKIQRFKCNSCGQRFSSTTGTLAYNQKKRRVNSPLSKLLAAEVSMRKCAKILNIHRTTVKRKYIFLKAKQQLQ